MRRDLLWGIKIEYEVKFIMFGGLTLLDKFVVI